MMTLGAGSVLSLWVLGIKLRLSGVCVCVCQVFLP